MKAKPRLSTELENALEKWAEESLAGIGVFRAKTPDFEKWKEKTIESLRSVYSDETIAMFLSTKDDRKIEKPDGFARITGSCGDTMEIFLKIDNGIITDCSFQTDGCNPSKAAGGMVAKIVKGEKINESKKLTPQVLLNALGGLPKEHEHCAALAIDTLKKALKSLEKSRRRKDSHTSVDDGIDYR